MRAGLAAVDITPPVGSGLNGFIARLSPSTGIDRPLMARALWLDDGDERGLLVGLDVLGLSTADADRIVTAAASRLGVPGACVVLACSHTHSGPMTVRLRGLGPADGAYVAALAQRIAAAGVAAMTDARPVQVRWGTAPVEISVNRREVRPDDGTIALGQNLAGPRDPVVRVLQLVGDGEPIVLFEHACHPYCLAGDDSLISPDFWGHAAEALAGRGLRTMYLNGCAGDLAPRAGFGGPEAARATGRALADAVSMACQSAGPSRDTGLRVDSARVSVPLDAMPPLKDVLQSLDAGDRTVRERERQRPQVCERIRTAWAEWAAELTDAHRRHGGVLPRIEARVSALRIGDGAVIVLPGEVFYEIGETIASRIDADPVCVAAYGHGYIGYVPDAASYARGGYEVDEAHRYTGLWRVAPQAGEQLAAHAVTLWRALGGAVR